MGAFSNTVGGFLLVVALGGAIADLTFTGNPAFDFADPTINPVTGRANSYGASFVSDSRSKLQVFDVNRPSDAVPDVGLPSQFPSSTVSGWDIKRVWFKYSYDTDDLHFGIECFGVCGDADGDGSEGSTGAILRALGGVDYPDLSMSEAFVFALDFNLDVSDVLPSTTNAAPFDFLFGVPGGQVPGSPALPCNSGLSSPGLYLMSRCLGVYHYAVTTSVSLDKRVLGPAFVAPGQLWRVDNHNPFPTLERPGLEWTIKELSLLRARAGAPIVVDRKEPWTFFVQGYGGSSDDAGIGADFFPSASDYITVSIPCGNPDACGICFGNGSSCADCAGVPYGTSTYDACGVCGGGSTSCRDCRGVLRGTSVFDACGVCDGDNSTCRDCSGAVKGGAVYDRCGVCGGDSRSCQDCKGVINGEAVYDACGVCGGDGTSCCGKNGKPCCVNYAGVPDQYWDYILLPQTIDGLIERFVYTKGIFSWLHANLPTYQVIQFDTSLPIGRMAEFNRLFLDVGLEPFCEASGVMYTELVMDSVSA